MRNKNLAHQKLENLDSSMINLQRMVKMGESKGNFIKAIEKSKDIIEELQDIVEQQKGFIGGEFRLGIIPTIMPTLLPMFLNNFVCSH